MIEQNLTYEASPTSWMRMQSHGALGGAAMQPRYCERRD